MCWLSLRIFPYQEDPTPERSCLLKAITAESDPLVSEGAIVLTRALLGLVAPDPACTQRVARVQEPQCSQASRVSWLSWVLKLS